MSKSLINDTALRGSYSLSPTNNLARSTYVRNDIEQNKMINNVASGKSKLHTSYQTGNRRHWSVDIPIDGCKKPSPAAR
jgi:hypothetical protein